MTLHRWERGMTDPAADGTTPAELHEVLLRSPLPLAIFALDTMLLVDANAAACQVIGHDFPVAEPVALGTLLVPDDATHAAHALHLIADGTIHAYEAHRKILRADGSVVDGHVWVRSIADVQHALAP